MYGYLYTIRNMKRFCKKCGRELRPEEKEKCQNCAMKGKKKVSFIYDAF